MEVLSIFLIQWYKIHTLMTEVFFMFMILLFWLSPHPTEDRFSWDRRIIRLMAIVYHLTFDILLVLQGTLSKNHSTGYALPPCHKLMILNDLTLPLSNYYSVLLSQNNVTRAKLILQYVWYCKTMVRTHWNYLKLFFNDMLSKTAEELFIKFSIFNPFTSKQNMRYIY